MKVKVREMELADIPKTIDVCEMHFNESQFNHHNFNRTKTMYGLEITYEEEDRFCLVVEEGEDIIGYIAGGYQESAVADYTTTYDHGFYIVPKKRNGRASVLLIKAFIKWAKSKKINYILLSNRTYNDGKASGVDKFIKRMGFAMSAGLYEYKGD